MENNSINDATQLMMEKVESSMTSAFELGMKYKRLEVVDSLVPILRENEFDDNTIAMILNDAKLLEDSTYADIFTNVDTDNV
jgi:hypothetical protein